MTQRDFQQRYAARNERFSGHRTAVIQNFVELRLHKDYKWCGLTCVRQDQGN
jgi:hypothetical protein